MTYGSSPKSEKLVMIYIIYSDLDGERFEQDISKFWRGVDCGNGGKDIAQIGLNNLNSTATYAIHPEDSEARIDKPDRLKWLNGLTVN